jgi:hypothetical protein
MPLLAVAGVATDSLVERRSVEFKQGTHGQHCRVRDLKICQKAGLTGAFVGPRMSQQVVHLGKKADFSPQSSIPLNSSMDLAKNILE